MILNGVRHLVLYATIQRYHNISYWLLLQKKSSILSKMICMGMTECAHIYHQHFNVNHKISHSIEFCWRLQAMQALVWTHSLRITLMLTIWWMGCCTKTLWWKGTQTSSTIRWMKMREGSQLISSSTCLCRRLVQMQWNQIGFSGPIQ